MRRYYFENGERLRADKREYRQRTLKQRQEYDRRYSVEKRDIRQRNSRAHYERNREERIAAARAWRQANPEEFRKHKRAWEERNPEAVRARAWRKHQRRQGAAPPTTEALEYMGILRCDVCAYCGAPAEEMDHVEPIARGGNGEWDNFTAACASCNRLKSDKPLLRFMRECLVA